MIQSEFYLYHLVQLNVLRFFFYFFYQINFKEGILVSNEPGYYENGEFGIRIENLINVKKNKKGYSFNNLTMAPIDRTLINKHVLKKDEINWLNNYHKHVFKNLKKFMTKSELLDLKQACSKI